MCESVHARRPQHISPGAAVGERGLHLINDEVEWKNLMQSLRVSGVSTNHAAKLLIIEYLQRNQKRDFDEPTIIEENSTETEDENRKVNISSLRQTFRNNVKAGYSKISKRRFSFDADVITKIRKSKSTLSLSDMSHVSVLTNECKQNSSENTYPDPIIQYQDDEDEDEDERSEITMSSLRQALCDNVKAGYAKLSQRRLSCVSLPDISHNSIYPDQYRQNIKAYLE